MRPPLKNRKRDRSRLLLVDLECVGKMVQRGYRCEKLVQCADCINYDMPETMKGVILHSISSFQSDDLWVSIVCASSKCCVKKCNSSIHICLSMAFFLVVNADCIVRLPSSEKE